jgi:hypothetical protein
MRLNGIMLEGTEMLSFCEIRRKSYLAPPPRSVTPPPEKIHSSLSASTIDKSSSAWTTWTSSSEDIVTAGNPSSLSPSQAAAPDPWSVNINDALDGTDGGEKPKESEFFNKSSQHSHLFHSSPASLADEQGIFLHIHNLSHDVESLALFHARQATQSIRVNSLS